MDKFADLRAKITPLLRPYVKRISVFGSYARGEQTPESDIDLLVALKPSEQRPPLGLFEIIWLEQELKIRLGHDVDLITEDGISFRIKSNVEKDRVVLYEENCA
jgi:predicted nucleotidyltransferase